ncbi:MAG: pirin family protein [Dehalococcoidia bacterium]|nr:pirin family protein [Dehalococcoidia bacterium]
MPAVTVDNILSLDRVTRPASDSVVRPVMTITTAPSGLEGEGFPVRRAFASIPYQYTDPFIMMDQMGEVEWRPGEAKGTPWHPHRGFETVTYMIEGTFKHRDSEGGGGLISDGDTQWMTAGAGILHIEAPTEETVLTGGLMHGVQLWVNLPREKKWADPRYQEISRTNLKLLSSHDGGALLRVIAGEVDGNEGPGVTHSPITFIHATVSPGAQFELPWRPDYSALAYVLAGRGAVGPDRRPFQMGQAAVFGKGDSIIVTADQEQDSKTPELEILILGGQPIREQIAWYGPFVMNTQEELQQAFADYQVGKLGVIPPEVMPHTTGEDATPGE